MSRVELKSQPLLLHDRATIEIHCIWVAFRIQSEIVLPSEEDTMGTCNYHKSICAARMYSNVLVDQACISALLKGLPISYAWSVA